MLAGPATGKVEFSCSTAVLVFTSNRLLGRYEAGISIENIRDIHHHISRQSVGDNRSHTTCRGGEINANLDRHTTITRKNVSRANNKIPRHRESADL